MTLGQRPERSKEVGLMNIGGITLQAEGTASKRPRSGDEIVVFKEQYERKCGESNKSEG